MPSCPAVGWIRQGWGHGQDVSGPCSREHIPVLLISLYPPHRCWSSRLSLHFSLGQVYPSVTEQLGATGLDGRAEAAPASRGLAFEVGPALSLCRGLPCSVWQRLPNLLLRWKYTLLLLLLRLYWEHSLGHCNCWHRVWNCVHHGGHCRNRYMHLHVHEKQPGDPRGSHQDSTHQRHLLSHGTAPLYL